jgi:hypothetical protein
MLPSSVAVAASLNASLTSTSNALLRCCIEITRAHVHTGDA